MDWSGFKARFSDVVAIPITPFTASDELDLPALDRILARMAEAGITAFTPNGNTGEYYSLTAAERATLVERTVAAVPSDALVVGGVGGALKDAINEARTAERAGAAGIMVHQPVHPYVSSDGWVAYHRAIAEAVPDLAVVLYVRDERVTDRLITSLAETAPNLLGVKYAVPSATTFALTMRRVGLERLTWIAGLAELSAPSYWAVGATGFTSGLANVHPSLALAVLRDLRAGDAEAVMTHWDALRPFEELRTAAVSEHNVSVVKEALHLLGLSERFVRPPMSEVPQGSRTTIEALVSGWGLTPG